MADGSDNWWNGWLQTAKEKSSSVLEFMKKDLDEFTNTFQQETSSFVSSTAATLRQKLNVDDSESAAGKVKRSVSGIIGSVSTALSISPEPNDEDDDVPFVIRDSEPVIMSRLELQLVLMQRETSTYLIEPPGKPEDYESWLERFNLKAKRDEMTELMSTNAYVRSLYGKLVPNQVSHSLFWHRYFYRVHQLHVAEAKRSMLKERAAGGQGTDLAWDEEDEISKQPLTPQETDRILNEYQKECEERELGSLLSQTDLLGKDAKLEEECSTSFVDVRPKDCVRNDGAAPKTLAEEISAEEDVPIVKDDDTKDRPTVVRLPKEEMSPSGKISDGSSNDDEWEKDFDVAVTDEDVQKVLKEGTGELTKNRGDEEWEKWQ